MKGHGEVVGEEEEVKERGCEWQKKGLGKLEKVEKEVV